MIAKTILLALFAQACFAQLVCTPSATGLNALSWNGVGYFDAATAGVPMESLTFDPQGANRFYFRPAIGSSSLVGSVATQNYAPLAGDTATATMTFSTSGNTCRIDYAVTNNNSTVPLQVGLAPFNLSLPSAANQFNSSIPLAIATRNYNSGSANTPGVAVGFLSGGWGSLAWWTTSLAANQGTKWSVNYGSAGQTLFRPLLTNMYTVGPTYTPQVFSTLIPASGGTVTWSVFLRFGTTTDTAITLAPEALASFAAATGQNANWPDRRPIGTWHVADNSSGDDARTSINPRGYDPPPSNALNALNPSAFSTWFNGQVTSVLTNLARINAQGVVLWDAEGLEFLQSLSYVGAPNHLSDLSPEMNTVIDAGMATIKAAGYKLGVTLRPQHLLYGTSLPGTCNSGPIANYDDIFVNTTAFTFPSSTRIYLCTATNTWTAQSNNGPQFQTDFLTSAYTSVITELEAKLSAAISRWGISFAYVDSVDWTDGTPYQWDLWQQLRTDFPNVQFFPEENSTVYGHWAYTLPYRKSSTSPTNIGFETPASVRAYYPTAGSFMDLGNEVLSANQAALQDGIAKGDISAVGVWFTNNPEQSNLIAYQANAQLTNSAAIVTDTSNNHVHSFQSNPGGAFTYPVAMRVYFAASSGGLSGSTTYCELKAAVSCWQSGTATNSASLNLSGLGWYMVSYNDFNCSRVSDGLATPLI